jgi:anti-sigma regulatory factor (Ser/Thr protein kinase)
VAPPPPRPQREPGPYPPPRTGHLLEAPRRGDGNGAVLLLSELITNAYRHAKVPAGREIRARCVLKADRLHSSVTDANDTLPSPRDASPDDESGRGLTLVAALADAWGAEPRPGGIGKTVWFELPAQPSPQARPSR